MNKLNLSAGSKVILCNGDHPKAAGKNLTVNQAYEVTLVKKTDAGREYFNIKNDTGAVIAFFTDVAQECFAMEGDNLQTQVMETAPAPQSNGTAVPTPPQAPLNVTMPTPPAAPQPPVPDAPGMPPMPPAAPAAPVTTVTPATSEDGSTVVMLEKKIKSLTQLNNSLTEELQGVKSALLSTDKDLNITRKSWEEATAEIGRLQEELSRRANVSPEAMKAVVNSISIGNAIEKIGVMHKMAQVSFIVGESDENTVMVKIDDFPAISVQGKGFSAIEERLADMTVEAFSENAIRIQTIQSFTAQIADLEKEKEKKLKEAKKEVDKPSAPATPSVSAPAAPARPPMKGKSKPTDKPVTPAEPATVPSAPANTVYEAPAEEDEPPMETLPDDEPPMEAVPQDSIMAGLSQEKF